MNFLKRWFFLFCNDLIFFLFSVYYFISLVVFRSKWSLYWNAPFERLHQFLIQPSLFRSVQMSDIRSGMYEYFFHSFIIFKEGIFWFYCLFFSSSKIQNVDNNNVVTPNFANYNTTTLSCYFTKKIRYDNNGVFILLPGSGFLPRSGIWFSKSSAIRSSWIVHRGNKLVQCWSLY